MSKFIWKENKVISLKLRNGQFVLIQLLKSPYVVVFNKFSNNNEWNENDANNSDILFFSAVARNVFQMSDIAVVNIFPRIFLSKPDLWIYRGTGNRKVKLWGNSPDEMEFITGGEEKYSIIRKDIDASGINVNRFGGQQITLDGYELVKDLELASIHVYPEFNERLLLCFQLGKNVDPAKELLFSQRLPIEYKTYFEIVSGKKKISEIGY